MSKAMLITVVNDVPILDWTGLTANEVMDTLNSFADVFNDMTDAELAGFNESETSLEELIDLLKNLPNIENEMGAE